MGVIRILPEALANRIAAGEVVERPASIVKELVENALDAGAVSIEISIRHGGKSLIRISDDGSGMSAEDAELAFQRYATSKIANPQDLARIASYGFRGEALPSVAAVSRLKLVTRTAERDTGTEINFAGGKLTGAKECPSRKGTTIEVQDLFFNTPARRKFMKADSTETGYVEEVVSNLALSRLDAGFHFKSSDKTVWNLPAGETLKARAASILGEEIAKQLLEIKAEKEGVSIWGLIGKPSAARANRSGQVFFVNRRWIKSTALSYGLQAGYHGLLMHGQFPAAILFVEVDLERVDVNVHPTKLEVRISSEAEIKALIQRAVSGRLAAESDLAPPFRAPSFGTNPNVHPAALSAAAEFAFSARRTAENLQAIAEPAAVYFVENPEAVEKVISLKDKLHITKILGQIHHTFILAETEEGLLILDQHAAHERVMFEALLKNFESENPPRQKLLMDEIVELPPKHQEILRQSMPTLAKIGFEIEEFGEKSFLIRAVPSILDQETPAVLLKSFLEEKEEGKLKTDLENQKEEIAALIACKRKSVKAFQPLSSLHLRSLLERLALCENPFSCPHGRPAFLKCSFLELEKQFKRK